MIIHKESSINLRVKLKFFANTHKASISKILCNSIAKFGLNEVYFTIITCKLFIVQACPHGCFILYQKYGTIPEGNL